MALRGVGGVLCAGNLVFDTLAHAVSGVRWDATTWVDSITQALGGNGANTAYTLAKLGARVRLLGMVGRDANGEFVLDALRGAGVDLSLVERSVAPTAATVALVSSEAARALLHRPGSSAEAFPSPVEFDHRVMAGCGRFHIANPFALPLMRRNAGDSLRRARQAGLATSLDAGWDTQDEWMKMLGPCLPHVEILFANQDEARRLSGCEDVVAASRFFVERGAGAVVIKLGGEGCVVRSDGVVRRMPGFEVNAVDTTGAGDCFVGGFLAALERGLPLERAAEVANAAGAMSVRCLGAVTGIGSWEETMERVPGAATSPGAT